MPIIYNKVSGAFVGLLQRQAMMQPKEVVIDNPEMKDINVSAEATGRVEAKYSVDVIARVAGFLLKNTLKREILFIKVSCYFKLTQENTNWK